MQRVDLVLHQRNQRGHHDADARTQQRRDLVTHRLAAAGRHQHDGVAPGNNVLDDLELLAAEAVEPENLAEHSTCAAFALAIHGQIRFAVSAVGPVRGEIAGITRNTLSSAKSYMSHTDPAATSKIPVPARVRSRCTPEGFAAEA